MNIFQALSILSQDIWLVHDSYLTGVYPMVLDYLSKASADQTPPKILEPECYYIVGDNATGFTAASKKASDIPQNAIAVIEVKGPITKESTCFSVGTRELTQLTYAAAENPKVGGIMYVADTGGGSVAGTETFARAINEVSQAKPTLVLAEDVLASAGIWIGVSAHHLFAQNKTTQIGSIGTAIMLTDARERLKSKGITHHYITATDSTAKNAEYYQALDGNKEALQKQLDAINTVFQDWVKANRPNLKIDSKTKAPLNGAMYAATEAAAIDLIDGVKSFSQSVQFLHNQILQNQ